MEAPPLTVADLIRGAAAQRRLSHEALGLRLGMSRQSVQARMSGRTPWTLSEAAKVAQLLDLDANALLEAASDGGEVLAS